MRLDSVNLIDAQVSGTERQLRGRHWRDAHMGFFSARLAIGQQPNLRAIRVDLCQCRLAGQQSAGIPVRRVGLRAKADDTSVHDRAKPRQPIGRRLGHALIFGHDVQHLSAAPVTDFDVGLHVTALKRAVLRHRCLVLSVTAQYQRILFGLCRSAGRGDVFRSLHHRAAGVGVLVEVIQHPHLAAARPACRKRIRMIQHRSIRGAIPRRGQRKLRLTHLDLAGGAGDDAGRCGAGL